LCFNWFFSVNYVKPEVLLHEVGHSFGLMHSNIYGEEYGDTTCVMGKCCGEKCFNAPQSENLGITQAQLFLTSSNFPINYVYTITLYSIDIHVPTFIKILPEWSLLFEKTIIYISQQQLPISNVIYIYSSLSGKTSLGFHETNLVATLYLYQTYILHDMNIYVLYEKDALMRDIIRVWRV
jgi:hypothetical protein